MIVFESATTVRIENKIPLGTKTLWLHRRTGTVVNAMLSRILLFVLVGVSAIQLAREAHSTESQMPELGEVELWQYLLLWTGDYVGMVDGVAGPGTGTAYQRFRDRQPQAMRGDETALFKALVSEGSDAMGAASFTARRDQKLDVVYGLPEGLVGPAHSSDPLRLEFRSPDGQIEIQVARIRNKYVSLDQLFRRLTNVPEGPWHTARFTRPGSSSTATTRVDDFTCDTKAPAATCVALLSPTLATAPLALIASSSRCRTSFDPTPRPTTP